ncbi:MAG: quinone-dependent dihydroorotate dehydrogenase [Rikenellaceae bacterium]
MYQRIIKPLLFKLSIDNAHRTALWLLHIVGMLPYGHKLLRNSYRIDHPSLERDVFGVKFRNPIGLAAGFDCNGDIINEAADIGFGFIEVGTITPEPQEGNPKPRIFRLTRDKAIVNRIGHANRGWQYAIENLRKKHSEVVVGCNIGAGNNTNPKHAAQDFLKCFRTLYQYSDYFTVNLTSDNAALDTKGYNGESLAATLAPLFEFRRGQSEYRPIMVKISPDVSDEVLDMVIAVMIDTPLDGIVAVAGTRQRENLKTSQASLSKIGSGRLSGVPLRERAIEVVKYIHDKTEGAYPIIGVGGMMTPADVARMMEAGASLVQLYTGFIAEGPSTAKKMCQSLIREEATDDKK